MSEYLIQGQTLTDIADAIRAKNGTNTRYAPEEMAAAIQAISGGWGSPEPSNDGKTRLYIHVTENAIQDLPPPRADVSLYISQTVSNGVNIDWGDGNEPETISGTGKLNITHRYEVAGDYVIALIVEDGCTIGLGWSDSNCCVLGNFSNNGRVYCNILQKIVIGDNIASIGSYAFSSCYSLYRVVIPNGITKIENSAFDSCYSLSSIFIPDSVVRIGSYAFRNCYGLKQYYIRASIPPDVESNTFDSISSDCIIYVPVGTAEIYKATTNWAALSDYIQENQYN